MISPDIDYDILGNDLQLLEIELAPSETIIGEAGAMNYMEEGIIYEARRGDGSLLPAGFFDQRSQPEARMLTDDSLFLTYFTNQSAAKRKMAFSSPCPGRIVVLDLAKIGGSVICQQQTFLCATSGTEVTVSFQQKLCSENFEAEQVTLQQLTGNGKAFVHAAGTVIKKKLQGETLHVEIGRLVAFSPGIEYAIQPTKNLKSMAWGRAGIVLATLSGEGTVLLQSLPFSRLSV